MNDALRIAAIGLQTQRSQLDVIAQNITNTNTNAYKRQRLEFGALLDPAANARSPQSTGEASTQNSALRVVHDLTPGELRASGSPLDVAIAGNGFIEVELEGNRTGLLRGGSLRIRDDGVLVTQEGLPLKADIRIPEGATQIEITRSGDVQAKLRGDNVMTVLGQIQLVTYPASESLEYLGNRMFAATPQAGNAVRSTPGEDGTGILRSGHLETSNVKLVDEMVTMMLAQRVYELNSKVAQIADEMMGLTNNLRR